MSEEAIKEQEENLIEVPEQVEEVEEVYDASELSPEEIEMAKEQGIKLDKGEEEKTKEKEDDDGVPEEKEEKEDEDDEEVLDPEDFDEMEDVLKKDENKFHKKFTPNAKALYFKHKKMKLRAQNAESAIEQLKAEKDLDTIKEGVNKKKLDKIREKIASGETTYDELNAILGEEEAKEEDTKEVDDKKQKSQERLLKQRAELADQIGRSKHENYDEVFNLAMEVMKEKPRYYESIAKMMNDNRIDEEEIVDEVVFIAQRNPKFKELGAKKASPEEQEKVDRAIKNSKKKTSSASLHGSGKGNFKSEDSLTPEDVARFTPAQFGKLSLKTQERLLREAG